MIKFTISMIIAATLFFGCDFTLSEQIGQSFPRLVTPLGAIEGYYKKSSSGRRYEAYEGIPYAQPPIGELRFAVPRAISPWADVLMAKQFSQECLQYDEYPYEPTEIVRGSEDCLYMNIYTVARGESDASREGGFGASNSNLQPVIFYIHGGAFQYGTGRTHGPDYLLNRNVTVVTFNYRLGPLGFLSTEDETVPGNMGLKDQIIALRWVKDNIQFFGGDPSRVTICGHSAGAISVHYHYLTKLSTGLFQRGMSLSGTALIPGAQVENPLEKTKKLGTIVGCGTKNIQSMVNCLRTRPAHQLMVALREFIIWWDLDAMFGPTVEKGSVEFTFINRSPAEIIASGDIQDVPWITGVASEEGLYPVAHLIANETLFEEMNDNWDTVAPHLLSFQYTVSESDHPKIARLIKEHYFGTSEISRTTFNQTVQMVGDRLFYYDVQKAARSQAKANRSPVRFYYFSYRGARSESESAHMSGTRENFGVSHSDDRHYVMKVSLEATTTAQDRDMQNQLLDLWVSYAAEGIPDVGIEWPVVSRSTEEFSYLHIAGPGEFSIKETTVNFGQKNFWSRLGIRENVYDNHTIA